MSAKQADNPDLIAGWTREQIDQLELSFLHKAFSVSTPDAVDVMVAYASYMSGQKLDSDNYPVFLKLLQLQNHWVADALLGKSNPQEFFRSVQPNQFILSSCFKMLTAWRPGEMYSVNLLVVIGLLRRSYEQPRDGYRVYSLSVNDVNNLAKHLDENKGQADPLNQAILHLLDRFASMADPGSTPPSEKQMADVATQSNNIRGKFLDMTKHLDESIPSDLLRRGDYRQNEVAPSASSGVKDSTKK